ncbi:MAG: cytochrome c maturation protein CcmE [Candidatus Thermoplasmatota archaeon]|nr:cytochrome c maturation protein CcmE [Candidatus Thermoplasmatota archaeon]
MTLSRSNRLLVVGLLFVAILGMAMISIEPEVQYTVDEVLSSPSDFEDGKVFLRGEVSIGSLDSQTTTFELVGVASSLVVDFSGVAIPDGFHEGLTISVRGTLANSDGSWTLLAHEIQTGCPSKYEAA